MAAAGERTTAAARRRRPHRHLSKFSLAALALLAIAIGPLAVASVSAADPIEQGRQTYDEFCAPCHGRDMVNTSAITFNLRRFPANDRDRFRNAVMNGKGSAMPAWRDRITDEDLDDLWAYVRSGG